MTDKEFVVSRFEAEAPLFKKVLKAVPAANLEYRPHQMSRSGGELVAHLLGHVIDLHELLDSGVIHHRVHEPFDSLYDAQDRYREENSRLIKRLKELSITEWNSRDAKMFLGDQVIMEGKFKDFITTFLFDSIHHRGQLCSYIRLMGGKIPGTYGPSADDLAEMNKEKVTAESL
jgi:uncharacterized damage-inducible protein DinB